MSAMKRPLFAGNRERAETLTPLRIIIYRQNNHTERHDRTLLYALSMAKGRAIAFPGDYGDRSGSKHSIKKVYLFYNFFYFFF